MTKVLILSLLPVLLISSLIHIFYCWFTGKKSIFSNGTFRKLANIKLDYLDLRDMKVKKRSITTLPKAAFLSVKIMFIGFLALAVIIVISASLYSFGVWLSS